MTDSRNRGFHFLVGIAVMWLLWRLHREGIIFNSVMLLVGQEGYMGPGAVVVSVIVEGIIAIGWVATLVVSGLWDGLYAGWLLVRDALVRGNLYLTAAAKSRVVEIKEKQASAEPAEVQDSPATPQPKTQGEALLAVIADTRKQADEQAAAIARIEQAVASLAAAIKPVEESTK